jgi:hypothetical protein
MVLKNGGKKHPNGTINGCSAPGYPFYQPQNGDNHGRFALRHPDFVIQSGAKSGRVRAERH